MTAKPKDRHKNKNKKETPKLLIYITQRRSIISIKLISIKRSTTPLGTPFFSKENENAKQLA